MLETFNKDSVEGLICYLREHFLEEVGKVIRFSPSYTKIAGTMEPWIGIMNRDEVEEALKKLRSVLLESLEKTV